MNNEYCPSCTVSRAMTAQRSQRKTIDKAGRTKRLETTSYHCERCGVFVKSEDRELS